MHMSDASYENICYLLDSMGVDIGDWQHSRHASRDGMKEKETDTLKKVNPATKQHPTIGYSADKVSNTTLALIASKFKWSCMGAQKRCFFAHKSFLKFLLITRYSRNTPLKNMCAALHISPNDLKYRLTGVCMRAPITLWQRMWRSESPISKVYTIVCTSWVCCSKKPLQNTLIFKPFSTQFPTYTRIPRILRKRNVNCTEFLQNLTNYPKMQMCWERVRTKSLRTN